MKKFAYFIQQLERSNKTNDKVAAIVQYLQVAAEEDKIWLLALFTGKRPKRAIATKLLKQWAIEEASIPEWLFVESYSVVGDLGETISLLLPEPTGTSNQSISGWIRELENIKNADEEQKKLFVLDAWYSLDTAERLIFNKLIGGGFRVGVSQKLLINALSKYLDIPAQNLAHSIMGNWDPFVTDFNEIIKGIDLVDNPSQPYPFCLAYPLEAEVQTLGDTALWQAEWKWDGIRGQIIKRQDEVFIWSRGEELITKQFPELEALSPVLPNGVVLDGEILANDKGDVLSFSALQKRLNRKSVSKKLQEEVPIGFFAYDILEFNGEDIRTWPLRKRRAILEDLLQNTEAHASLYLSPVISFSSWESLATERKKSREMNSEGIMLKHIESPFHTGRKRGDWWKWKVDPFTIDAVMIYAQKGAGRRSNFYTDYTFAVQDGEALVTIAKAYSGLTDQEIKKVDSFVKRNATEKFGPVRTVKPELVFELAFEGIAESSRHKAGLALRFPRIKRWRHDKKPADINTLQDLRNLLESTTHADK